jgi:hypothetical protein
MWQAETYDPATIDRELGWAEGLGFNTLRVYLHDLVWRDDADGFAARIDDVLTLAERRGMAVILVLFDDCHRPDPRAGPQPPPVRGVHNSEWKQSPGEELVRRFDAGTAPAAECARLDDYVGGVLERFGRDARVLMWDLYNEAGNGEKGDASHALLKQTWARARAAAPSQPLTACIEGAVGERNRALNAAASDVVTFHCYVGARLEETLERHARGHAGRPAICTEYMARELGTTFRNALPLFKRYGVGCLNWGLVAGKSQTHFNWKSIDALEKQRARGAFLRPGEPVPEPPLWFHDIFRVDGTPFDAEEVAFIKRMTGAAARPGGPAA